MIVGHASCLRQYSGQADVFLDDYCGKLPFDLLLALLDRYAYPQCRRVVITSNAPPERWYPASRTTQKELFYAAWAV